VTTPVSSCASSQRSKLLSLDLIKPVLNWELLKRCLYTVSGVAIFHTLTPIIDIYLLAYFNVKVKIPQAKHRFGINMHFFTCERRQFFLFKSGYFLTCLLAIQRWHSFQSEKLYSVCCTICLAGILHYSPKQRFIRSNIRPNFHFPWYGRLKGSAKLRSGKRSIQVGD
jgi:hypothetical protein